MKKIIAIAAAMASFATPVIAQAATPDGDHTFSGRLEVRKTLPFWTECDVDVVINVTGGVPVLQSATVSGGVICDEITFKGLPSGPLDTTNLPTVVVPPTIGVNLPFGFGSCAGSLTVFYDNSALPRTITFVDGISDITGPPPCRIQGTLTQTSTPPLTL